MLDGQWRATAPISSVPPLPATRDAADHAGSSGMLRASPGSAARPKRRATKKPVKRGWVAGGVVGVAIAAGIAGYTLFGLSGGGTKPGANPTATASPARPSAAAVNAWLGGGASESLVQLRGFRHTVDTYSQQGDSIGQFNYQLECLDLGTEVEKAQTVASPPGETLQNDWRNLMDSYGSDCSGLPNFDSAMTQLTDDIHAITGTDGT
jgi:hypothetical protein